MSRVIVHIDLNAFFATCEELRNPSLARLPLIIGHSGRSGIVSTCNYIARKYGIHSGQPTFQALKCCPQAKIVPPDFSYYEVMSTSFFFLIKEYCKKIEVASIDECYCDFSEVLSKVNDPVAYLKAIQLKVKNELGLSCSMGVAPTKWLAKMGSDLKKPMGLTIIRRKDIPSIIYPLPINAFWGIGKKTAPLLQSLGIKTIGDLKAALDENRSDVLSYLGKFASTCKSWVNGYGEDEVTLYHQEAKSIGNSHTLSTDCESLFEFEKDLRRLCEEVSYRLKKAHKRAHCLTLTVKDTSFHLHSKASSLEEGYLESKEIYDCVSSLYQLYYEGKYPIRLIGVSASKLFSPNVEAVQLSLFNDVFIPEDKTRDIISNINKKMGEDTLKRLSSIKKGHS